VDLTSPSLLERLKHASPDAPEWQRLHDLYLPVLRSWLSRLPDLRNDVEDVAQEVLLVVMRELPGFVRQRDGAFRAWLRQITVNRIRSFRRARAAQPAGDGGDELLAQLEDPGSNLSRLWDQDHDRHVLQKLLATVRPDFSPQTWAAFTRFALDGVPAARAAEELGITESAVVQAKFRVLKRLREEMGDLID
jgi:RNA polymerase sigma-70 factor (ECF subfamily)